MKEKVDQLQAKLEADAGLGEKIFSQKTPEGVQAVLKEAGLDFSLEEINQLREIVTKASEMGVNGELSDEALENVAGGSKFVDFLVSVGEHFLDDMKKWRW